MNFGFTACHSSVPSVQRLAVYLADEFALLEQGLALTAPPKTTSASRRKLAIKTSRAAKPRKTVKA
jgi:hypothetical protein